MIIRKLFKFEGAHIVRDCSSQRCSTSIHGHSYVVEIFLTARGLDNGQMIVDFGLLKTTIKDIVDSFDHAWSYWNRESEDFRAFVRKESARWIEMPVSPSAEMYSLMFFFILDKVIQNTEFNNGEKGVRLHSVRVHETETGYAESFRDDLVEQWNYTLNDIKFSEQVCKEWTNPYMWEMLKKNEKFVNPIVSLKYNK